MIPVRFSTQFCQAAYTRCNPLYNRLYSRLYNGLHRVYGVLSLTSKDLNVTQPSVLVRNIMYIDILLMKI